MNKSQKGVLQDVLSKSLDPLTGRLNPAECAALYSTLARSLDTCWAAVALAVPPAWRPTPEDWTRFKRRRGSVPVPCPGCAREECRDCARTAEQLGCYTEEELDEAVRIAGILGCLTFADLDREKRRRELFKNQTG